METTVARTARETIPRERLVGVLAGIGVGTFVLFAFGFSSNWATYIILAAAIGSVSHVVTRITGGAERLFVFLFIFALQAQLGFNPIYWEYSNYKMAGPVGLYISLILITAVALIAVWSWQGLLRVGRPFVLPRSFLIAAGCLTASSFLSIASTTDKSLTIFGIFEIISLTTIALVAYHFSSTIEGVTTIRKIFPVMIFVQSMVILVQNLTGLEFGLQYGVTSQGNWENARFAGTLVRPSVSGTLMVLGLLFILVHLFGRRPLPGRLFALVVAALALLDLLLSETRSAWIGFTMCASGLIVSYLYRRGTLRARHLVQMGAAAVLAILIALPALADRLSAPHSDDAMVRWNLVIIASKMIRAHPLLGMGLNTATQHVTAFASGMQAWVFIVHNQYLLVAIEMGFLGLAAFLYLVLGGLRATLTCMNSETEAISDAAAVVFWCLIAMTWAMMLDHVSGTMTYVYLWFLIGMGHGLAVARQRAAA